MALIGISGKIGSGKDLLGQIINYLSSDYYPNKSFNRYLDKKDSEWGPPQTNWEIKKFADKLKDIVCLLLGCTREQLEDRDFKEKELGEEWWLWETEGYNSERYIYKTKQEALESQGGYYQPKLVKLTPRKILQLLGTEAGRGIIHPQIWVNSLMADYKRIVGFASGNYYCKCGNCGEQFIGDKRAVRCEKCSIFHPNWIVTDTRFPNELQAIKDKGGITIRINRYPKTLTKCRGPQDCEEIPFDPSNDVHIDLYRGEQLSAHESETALDNAEFDYVVDNNGTIEDLIEKIKEIMIKEKLI